MQESKGKINIKLRMVITSEEKEGQWDGEEHKGHFKDIAKIFFLQLIAEHVSLRFLMFFHSSPQLWWTERHLGIAPADHTAGGFAGRLGPAGDAEEEEKEELSSSCEEEREEHWAADEGEGDEDIPTSPPGSGVAV